MPATAEEDCPARDGCDTTDDDGGERLNRRAFRFQRLEFVRQLLHMALLAAYFGFYPSDLLRYQKEPA